jgi:hypothetical protein
MGMGATEEAHIVAMNKAQFKQKWEDTHTELSALDRLEKGRKGSSLKTDVTDKQMAKWNSAKKLIEAKGMRDREEAVQHLLIDALAVRNVELLDKKDLPMYQLLGSISKMKTQKVEGNVQHTHTFADMIKKVTLEKVDTIDAN